MVYDTIIKGGRVIDPARGIDQIEDIYIINSKIVSPPGDPAAAGANEIIDAEGHLVLPGLIDLHVHANHLNSALGVPPDLAMIPNGVTSCVDMGSGGYANVEGYLAYVAAPAQVTIKSFLNIASTGVMAMDAPEDLRHDSINGKQIRRVFETHGSQLLGLKVRLGGEAAHGLHMQPLIDAIELAEEIGCAVCCHAVEMEDELKEVMKLLRKGDIFTHIFNARGPYNYTILGHDGKVQPEMWAAKERGVIMDVASARRNVKMDVAKAAVEQGFLPDTLSTDLVTPITWNSPKCHSILLVMAWFHGMGMGLHDIVRAVTETPTRIMGLEGEIGTLAPGAFADISIIKVKEWNGTFTDLSDSAPINIPVLFLPMATFKKGRLLYHNLEFAFRG